MDELIAYIISLLNADPELLTLVQAAGRSTVQCLAPKQRTNATYPQIVIYGYEGQQLNFSENGNPKFFKGMLKLDIVTRKSDNNPDPLTTLVNMKARITDLLLGNPDLTPKLPGIQGQKISSTKNIPCFYQMNPTGYVDEEDPVFERWNATYSVTVNRIVQPAYTSL